MKTTVVETQTVTHCGIEHEARREQRGKLYVWTFYRADRERTNCTLCGKRLTVDVALAPEARHEVII